MARRRRRDIPWGMWAGCLVAACLAHALLIVPGGNVLARSLAAGYEPKPANETVLELDLEEPEEPPPPELDEDDGVEDSRTAHRRTDVKREAKPPKGDNTGPAKADGEDEPEPGAEAETPNVDPDQDLVEAPDGTESNANPTPAEVAANWGKLGGSPGVLHDSFGTAGSHDRAPNESTPGRESLLESKENLYASFFSRMRGRVLEHWNPQKAIDRYDPQGVELGGVAQTTVVTLRIDRSGGIDDLSFARTSDVHYLDAETLRALKAAGPFPNPPSGLFDDGDTFSITVAFTVEPNGGIRVTRRSR